MCGVWLNTGPVVGVLTVFVCLCVCLCVCVCVCVCVRVGACTSDWFQYTGSELPDLMDYLVETLELKSHATTVVSLQDDEALISITGHEDRPEEGGTHVAYSAVSTSQYTLKYTHTSTPLLRREYIPVHTQVHPHKYTPTPP